METELLPANPLDLGEVHVTNQQLIEHSIGDMLLLKVEVDAWAAAHPDFTVTWKPTVDGGILFRWTRNQLNQN